MLLKFECAFESPRDLVKLQILTQWGWGEGLWSFFSNKLLGDTDLTGPWIALWEAKEQRQAPWGSERSTSGTGAPRAGLWLSADSLLSWEKRASGMRGTHTYRHAQRMWQLPGFKIHFYRFLLTASGTRGISNSGKVPCHYLSPIHRGEEEGWRRGWERGEHSGHSMALQTLISKAFLFFSTWKNPI